MSWLASGSGSGCSRGVVHDGAIFIVFRSDGTQPRFLDAAAFTKSLKKFDMFLHPLEVSG